MDPYLKTHILVQIGLSIPFALLLYYWEKTSWILRLIVITTFLLTLPSWRLTFFHNPVNYELDLSKDQAGKVYEFEFYPIIEDSFIVGFRTHQSGDVDMYWPNFEAGDVEILFKNTSAVSFLDDGYKRYSSGGNPYDGRFLMFLDPLKKQSIKYKIKTNPPIHIKSLWLDLSMVYFDDIGIGFFYRNLLNGIFVYGSLLIYFFTVFIVSCFRKNKRTKK